MPLGYTPALLLPTIAEGDNNKYLIHNTAIQGIEDSLHKVLAVDLTSGNKTLSETEFVGYGVYECSGHTVARDLIVPQQIGSPAVDVTKFFFVINNGTSSGVVTVKHATGSTVSVAIGETVIVRADGTDITLLGSVGGTLGALSDTTISGAALGQVLLYNGSSWVNDYGNYRVTNDQTGTTYTFVLTDSGKIVRFDNAASIAVTIPTNASVAFPIGTSILLRQVNAGVVTVAGDVGVTMNTPDDGVMNGAGDTALLVKVDTDEWDLVKDQTAASQSLSINNQSGTTYTFVLSDADTQVRLSNASSITLTVPNNASVAFPVGTQIHAVQAGAGVVTIAAGGGVTLNSPAGLVFLRQYQRITFVKVATDTWDIHREPAARFRLIVPVTAETGAFTDGANKMTFRMTDAVVLTKVKADVVSANSSGGPVTVDINESGVSILSTKLTIDDTEETSETAATPAVISDANIADNAKITIDIDSGSNDAVGLKVTFIGYYA